MKIELAFENIPSDLEGAIVDIRVEDQSEADSPAPQLFSQRFGPFSIRQVHPNIILDVDPTVPDRNQELSIVVRVKAHTKTEQPIEFLNTTTTPLPKELNRSVQVMLSRIS